ncbi:MAG: hypothetical protein IPQ13_11720 [Holophagaceae bacterium]|nr:hypothetical protein [Holophagaceae bacterium]
MKTTLLSSGLDWVRAFTTNQPAFRRTVFFFCQRFLRLPVLRRSTAALVLGVMLATPMAPLFAQTTITITPASTNVIVGETQAFTSNVTATWTVQESGGGSITSGGLYTAPTTPGTYHVVATNTADPNQTATATVSVDLLDISGTYTDNFNETFTLFQNGDQVWGIRGGSYPIAATLSGRTLTGTMNYPNGTLALNFVWTFTSTASSYSGAYGMGMSAPAYAWTGTKLAGVSVEVNPRPAVFQVGALQAFTAFVAGSSNKSVTWTASAGTIDSAGLFTAPAQPQMVTVTATSVADAAKSNSRQFQVTADGQLDVSGTYVDMYGYVFTQYQNGAQIWGTRAGQNLVATISGLTLTGVTNNPDGTLASNYVWTFASDAGSYTGLYGVGAATPSGAWNGTKQPGVSVEVHPKPASIQAGALHTFTASVAGSLNKEVTWTASAGLMDATGHFTAPPQPQVVTVTATSIADPTKTASLQIPVTFDGILDVSGTYTSTQPGNGTLFQSGTTVYGTLANISIQGTLNGLVLSGRNQDVYTPGNHYFQFTFSADGSQFSGYYDSATPNPTAGPLGFGTRQAGVVSVDLNPKLPVVKVGVTRAFTALVAGSLNKTVGWAATAGTINSSGVFTAPAQPQVVTVTASPAADPSKQVSTQIQVTFDGVLDVSGTFTGTQPGNGTLFQHGTAVSGTLGDTFFQGILDGRVLSGSSKDPYNSPKFFQFTFTGDGNQFSGIYSGLAPKPVAGTIGQGVRQAGTSVQVTPASSQVPFPWNQSFLSLVAGTLDKRVTWTVMEANGGTINAAGTYTPPNLAGTYTVKATSVADATASGTALVTVPFQISVDPNAASIRPSSSIKLRATVTGTPNGAVTWSVTESGGGTVAADGTYTAPAAPGFYHVVATSVADSTKTAQAPITVETAAPISVAVAPYATQLNKGGTAAFTATVQGSTNTAVTWTATGGTMAANGTYTSPNAFGTYTVTATSVADPTAFAVATVVVSALAGQDKSFTYDLNGNMTGDGERTFEWDDENRLIAVNIVATGHRSEFRYDGLGRRVGIVEKDMDAQGNLVPNSDKKYLWDGVEIAEERSPDGGTVAKRFYTQGFVDNDGTALFYSRDHLGSIRELTDSTQAMRARYDYDPYGRMTKIQGNRDSLFGYTGHMWHSQSGLNLALYRAYDANLGRWISQDPIQEKGGINLYNYCLNNTINKIDPTGQEPITITVAAIAGAAALAALIVLGILIIAVIIEQGTWSITFDLPPPKGPNPLECWNSYLLCNRQCDQLPSPSRRAVCRGQCSEEFANCLAGRPRCRMA